MRQERAALARFFCLCLLLVALTLIASLTIGGR